MYNTDLGMFTHWLLTSGISILITIGLMIALMVIVTFSLSRVSKSVAKKITDDERKKRLDTLFGVAKQVARLLILVIGTLIILPNFGIDLGPILATVGILGLAVSFGAQSLVKDIISGFFILAENQIRVGDVVKIGEFEGKVEEIKIRTIVLRDISGNVHIIPNGKVEEVTNMSKQFSKSLLDIGVSYREDVDAVMEVIREEGLKLAEDKEFGSFITEPIEVLGVQDLADSAVVIRSVITTVPAQQWVISREFRRRIKKRFDADGIEIPYPHQTVYWGEPKDGKQQGLLVNIRENAGTKK